MKYSEVGLYGFQFCNFYRVTLRAAYTELAQRHAVKIADLK